MATFYLPASGYYSAATNSVLWKIKIVEDYSQGNQLKCSVIASTSNASFNTSGTVTFYLNSVELGTVSWSKLLGSNDVTIASTTITLTSVVTQPEIKAKLYSSNSEIGTTTRGGIVALTTYAITYNGNADYATNIPESQSGLPNTTLTLSEQVPKRIGYDFLGWSTTTSGLVEYNPSDTYTLTEDLVLYAVWKLKSYKITFDTNGGSSVDDIYVEHGSTIGKIPITTRKGYAFERWNTLQDGSGVDVDGTTEITSNMIVYAIWKHTNIGYLKVNGEYVKHNTYIKINNKWTPFIAYHKDNSGIWRQGSI